MEFGNTANSAIEAQGKASIRVWALNRMQDVKGNYLAVAYAEDSLNGEYRPTQIDYTGNSAGGLTPGRSVRFEYGTRTDIYPLYVGGSQIKTTQLLTNVKTYLGDTPVRDYRLQYAQGTATKRSRLTSITECAGDGVCLPATTFTWSHEGSFTYTWGWYDELPALSTTYWWLGDFNADGRADLATYQSPNLYTYLSNPGQPYGGHTRVSTPIND